MTRQKGIRLAVVALALTLSAALVAGRGQVEGF
jgi:hypothetical protein